MSIDFSIQQQGVTTQQNVGFSSSSAAVGSLFGNAAAVDLTFNGAEVALAPYTRDGVAGLLLQ